MPLISTDFFFLVRWFSSKMLLSCHFSLVLNHRLRIIELLRLENTINIIMPNHFSRALSYLLLLLFSCTLCCWTIIEAFQFQQRKWCYATLHLLEFYFEVLIWSFLCCCLAEVIIYRIFFLLHGHSNGRHIINILSSFIFATKRISPDLSPNPELLIPCKDAV